VLVGEAKIPIFTVFGLTYHIVLKNDILFVPSGRFDWKSSVQWQHSAVIYEI
jgi:hypothetical protein